MVLYYFVTLFIQLIVLLGDSEFHKLENTSKAYIAVIGVLFCWVIVPYLIGRAIIKSV